MDKPSSSLAETRRDSLPAGAIATAAAGPPVKLLRG